MSILGLTSTETFNTNGFYAQNDRRSVFREFPNGAAPLTGLLSLMSTEDTDNSEFGWFEKRFSQARGELSQAATAKGPFSATGSDTPSADSPTLTAGTVYRLRVEPTSEFRVADVIWLQDYPMTGGGTQHLKGVVTEIVSTTKIEIRMIETATGVDNTASAGAADDAMTLYFVNIGTANAEGASSGSGRFIAPVNVSNYTQIFRNAFSFTRTALKHPATFDRTGLYREKAKDNAIDHMVGIEMASLFGTRRYETITTPDGETVPERKMGGLLWYLEQWEKGNTGNSGAFDYRPAGSYDSSDVSAAADSNELKRIINNTAGTISKRTFDDYLRRAFEVTNNRTFEKLCLCGSGFLATINSVYERYSMTMKSFPAEEAYGMNVTKVETAHGILYFKQHPLFNRDVTLRHSAFILDVNNLKYRALNDSDTILLKNRQANDADRRKDEWLTEAGIEVNFPESHMFIRNLQNVN
jgi:hypothetical protein